MQTSKYEIGANLQGLEFRRQANEILAALASSNAGNLEPASARAGTVWLDTSNDKKHLLKIRNKANNAWGILCSIDAQSGAVDAINAYTKQESNDKFALKYAAMLPNGDYTKVGFWRNLEAGKYFASIPALKSQGQIPKNYPSEYGFIELIVIGGERYVLWQTFNLVSVALRFNQIPSDDANLEWAPINGERFLNVGRLLPQGDASLSSYWNNLKSGTYYYNEGINTVSNMPNGTRTAHIEYRNVEGEIAVICYTSDAKIFIRSGTPTIMRPWAEITTPSLGVNQTVQDVKSQRRAGEIYTNNTDKPIFISVVCESSSQGGTYEIWLEVNGIAVQKAYSGAISGLSPKASVCGVIPAGATYKIITYNNVGSTVIAGWTELR